MSTGGKKVGARVFERTAKGGEKNRRVRVRRQKAERARPDPRRRASVRMTFVALGMFGLACVLIAQAYLLQVKEGSYYVNAKRRQSTTTEVITARRGIVKDRHLSDLAVTVDVDSVFLEPKVAARVGGIGPRLAEALDLSAAAVEAEIQKDRPFTYLKRRVTAEDAQRVKALERQVRAELDERRRSQPSEQRSEVPDRPGFGTQAEPRRFYPNRSLAAHVLGFTDPSGVGASGAELAFEKELQPQSVEVPAERDGRGQSILKAGFVPQVVLDGDDVILTIDRQLQYVAEQELAKAVTENRGRAGVAIVMKADTGDILAMASYPTFNPNNLRSTLVSTEPGRRPPNPQLNHAIKAVYEPGSTLKMVTIAAGLEERVIAENDQLDCENGRWRVGGRTIRDSHPYGKLSISDVMKHSSNICSAKVGIGLGRERLHDWLERFGFGQPTGIELGGEQRGILHAARSWREITLVNVAFGQGLAVTPLQVVQAASVFANEGLLVRPRILVGTVDKKGERALRPVETPERVLSAETARRVRAMMEEVTQKGGTAVMAAIPGFSVAGKTGTAQKVDEVTGAYSQDHFVSSFVGFVPAEKPEIVALVLVDDPDRAVAHFGGKVAGPAFQTIASVALTRLGVFPKDPVLTQDALLKVAAHGGPPRPIGVEDEGIPIDAVDAGNEQAMDRALDRARTALEPRPGLKPDEEEAAGGLAEEAAMEARADGAIMPNMEGLSAAEVLKRSAEIPCTWVLLGTGRVVKQTPGAGMRIAAEDRCELALSPRG